MQMISTDESVVGVLVLRDADVGAESARSKLRCVRTLRVLTCCADFSLLVEGVLAHWLWLALRPPLVIFWICR